MDEQLSGSKASKQLNELNMSLRSVCEIVQQLKIPIPTLNNMDLIIDCFTPKKQPNEEDDYIISQCIASLF